MQGYWQSRVPDARNTYAQQLSHVTRTDLNACPDLELLHNFEMPNDEQFAIEHENDMHRAN